MALVMGLRGELQLFAPDGKIVISVGGRIVAVTGSKPRSNTRWYRDMLKRAREVVKTRKPRRDLVMKATEKDTNPQWFMTLLTAAEDCVKRHRPERPIPSVRGAIPLRNGLELRLAAK